MGLERTGAPNVGGEHVAIQSEEPTHIGTMVIPIRRVIFDDEPIRIGDEDRCSVSRL